MKLYISYYVPNSLYGDNHNAVVDVEISGSCQEDDNGIDTFISAIATFGTSLNSFTIPGYGETVAKALQDCADRIISELKGYSFQQRIELVDGEVKIKE